MSLILLPDNTMLKFIFSVFIIAFSSAVIAQNNKEIEIYVNGELEKVSTGRKNIFITGKGDTIEYSVDDILKQMMKSQPKKIDSAEVVNKTIAEQKEVATNKKAVGFSPEEQSQKDLNKEKELKEKQEILAKEKQIAEKKVLENRQKEMKELESKKIEEEKIIELKKNVKTDSVDEAKKEIERQYMLWVDSLEQTDGKNEELKTISGKVTYSRELYPTGNNEVQVVKDTISMVSADNIQVLPVEEKVVENENVSSVVEKVEEKVASPPVDIKVNEQITSPIIIEEVIAEKETAIPVVEAENKPVKVAEVLIKKEEIKTPEIQKTKFEFKKYFLHDPMVSAENIGLKDTLTFIYDELTFNKNFPSMELGSANNFSLCYDYTVCNYHGYDEETIARQTTRYKVCLSGTMNDKNKVAEVYIDTKTGRKKIYYSVALLDDKKLVLIKR